MRVDCRSWLMSAQCPCGTAFPAAAKQAGGVSREASGPLQPYGWVLGWGERDTETWQRRRGLRPKQSVRELGVCRLHLWEKGCQVKGRPPHLWSPSDDTEHRSGCRKAGSTSVGGSASNRHSPRRLVVGSPSGESSQDASMEGCHRNGEFKHRL